jgi:hypothetical protein
MLQAHTCVSVCCDQCGHILGRPERALHFRTDSAAINAATTERWRIEPDGQWWCAGTTARVAVTAQLPTDRRRATTQLGRDRPHRKPLPRCRSAMRTRSFRTSTAARLLPSAKLITGG